ncbi:hypothetical protein M404DRAFT_9910 [Pisolithus tinctorius Marx 270]|uniref:Uncharacterized protein n=1 Tax=Pisolithus tinctorius Marx 270 TaxID=870435 RepID=A0A0C3P418_PISTI|nr:hypothetical protein M404DRAFT_9910 [Pisolithus tinctorius Marx 270]
MYTPLNKLTPSFNFKMPANIPSNHVLLSSQNNQLSSDSPLVTRSQVPSTFLCPALEGTLFQDVMAVLSYATNFCNMPHSVMQGTWQEREQLMEMQIVKLITECDTIKSAFEVLANAVQLAQADSLAVDPLHFNCVKTEDESSEDEDETEHKKGKCTKKVIDGDILKGSIINYTTSGDPTSDNELYIEPGYPIIQMKSLIEAPAAKSVIETHVMQAEDISMNKENIVPHGTPRMAANKVITNPLLAGLAAWESVSSLPMASQSPNVQEPKLP